jgi:hypothetical protein
MDQEIQWGRVKFIEKLGKTWRKMVEDPMEDSSVTGDMTGNNLDQDHP